MQYVLLNDDPGIKRSQKMSADPLAMTVRTRPGNCHLPLNFCCMFPPGRLDLGRVSPPHRTGVSIRPFVSVFPDDRSVHKEMAWSPGIGFGDREF